MLVLISVYVLASLYDVSVRWTVGPSVRPFATLSIRRLIHLLVRLSLCRSIRVSVDTSIVWSIGQFVGRLVSMPVGESAFRPLVTRYFCFATNDRFPL